MATENDTLEFDAEDALEQAMAPQGTATQATAPQSAVPLGHVSIPQSALGKIKADQRERGKREVMGELEAKFRAAGFGSIDEAIAQMATLRAPTPTTPVQQPQSDNRYTQESRQSQARAQADAEARKQMQALAKERERLAKQLAQEQAAKRKLESSKQALQAEAMLSIAAHRAGVQDADYAVDLCRRHLSTLDDDELETFDEDAFFSGLRKNRPYLFGETVVPADTGVGTNNAPVAPAAGAVQEAQAMAGQLDARKLSTVEFQKLLRSRNLSQVAS